MSDTATLEKPKAKKDPSKKSKVRAFFNNLFKTKLETDVEKLSTPGVITSDENEGDKGIYNYQFNRSGLDKQVKAAAGDLVYIEIGELSASIWCALPKSLWAQFGRDGQTLGALQSTVNGLADKLISEWSKCAKSWDRAARDAAGKNDEKGVKAANDNFDKEAEALRKMWEEVATETIVAFFEKKAEVFGDYKRYKWKAGAKLVSTFAGTIAAAAALGTAATPAAPATLVPALIGLVQSVGSIVKQVKDLAASAEKVETTIKDRLGAMEGSWKDAKGNWNKKTFQAREAVSAFASGMTGGITEMKFPSISALLSDTGLMKSKTDGLEVELSAMGNAINDTIDSLQVTLKLLEANETALDKALKSGKAKTTAASLAKKIGATKDAFEKMRAAFESDFDAIPEMADRVGRLRNSNEEFRVKLEEAEKALGTKNISVAVQIFVALGTIGAGFASPPGDLSEKIQAGLGTSLGLIDQLREYSPDIMEKALG